MVLDGALPQVLAGALVDHAEDEGVLLVVTLIKDNAMTSHNVITENNRLEYFNAIYSIFAT